MKTREYIKKDRTLKIDGKTIKIVIYEKGNKQRDSKLWRTNIKVY